MQVTLAEREVRLRAALRMAERVEPLSKAILFVLVTAPGSRRC